MPGAPYARVEVSRIGLAIGLALLAFGLFTAVTYFRSGGRGYGMTVLRALVAVPLGGVVLYLSFGSACSACGASLVRREVRTTASRATAVMQAAAMGDGVAASRALEAARSEAGGVRLAATVCPRCRRLARLQEAGASPRVLAGDAAIPLSDAVMTVPESN